MLRTTLQRNLFILSLTILPSNVYAQENLLLSQKISTIVDAKPISKFAPKYPINEARRGKEGWVVLSYVVESNGKVSNAIIEDSSGSRGFEKESLKIVKRWEFAPATENGTPITQCKNTVQMDFKMHNINIGVSKKFFKLYQSYLSALKNNNPSEISELLDKIANFKIKLGIESYYQQLALAQGAKLNEQPKKQLAHLNRALRFSSEKELLNKEKLTAKQKEVRTRIEKNIAPVLHQKLVLELEAVQLANAIKTIDRLLALEVNAKKHDAYRSQRQSISQMIGSEQHISVSLDLEDKETISYKLLRNNFQLQNINGRLTKLDLRCRNQRHIYTVNDRSQWSIPESWQACSVYFYGEDNTTFTIVELPKPQNGSGVGN